MKYYSLKKILKHNAHYNLIIGERSNGKTYSVLKHFIERAYNNNEDFAYIRRWAEDIRGRRGSEIFRALEHNNEIINITNGEYSGIFCYARKFYFCNYDDDGKAIYNFNSPIGFSFALSETEHDKSISFPNIYNIVFDEFLTNRIELNNEFMLFMNTLSTIIRQREHVKIFMLGNTVNKYSIYFKEMGLDNVSKMQQGDIDIYKYGDSGLKVAIEYCSPTTKLLKKNNYYFAFNSPKLDMIKSGAWELDIYPHLDIDYNNKDVVMRYFIIFDDIIYQCNIISKDNNFLTYIHKKTTPIKNNTDLIYTLEPNSNLYYNNNIYKPINQIQERILWFFKTNRVFYSDNNVGNSIHNFLKICRGGV